MDYSSLTYAKPTTLERLQAKAKQTLATKALDAAERKKCHRRSGGRCEIIVAEMKPEHSAVVYVRCKRRASQNHHLIGGRGRRNRGESVLAECRLDICALCHAEINAGVLSVVPVPVDGPPLYRYAATVRYWRRA